MCRVVVVGKRAAHCLLFHLFLYLVILLIIPRVDLQKMSVSSASLSNNNDVAAPTSGSDHDDDDDDTSMMRVPPFVPDQVVFCADDSNGGTLYEALVRKTSWTGQHWKFLVHYKGWNARFDRWLPETSLHADSPEIRQRALESSAKKKRSNPEETSSRKKQKRLTERGPSYADYCELPFSLKTILVEDKERIMAPMDSCSWRPARSVHDLPARVSVKQVLHHFCKCKKKEYSGTDEAKAQEAESKAQTFCSDLAHLFDTSLGVCLLYPPERAQHDAIEAHPELSQKRKCDLYGCEFLLRFLVRLPVLLEQTTTMNNIGRKEVGTLLADLIQVLQKNRQACFKARYRPPKDEELNDWEKAFKDGSAPIAMDE